MVKFGPQPKTSKCSETISKVSPWLMVSGARVVRPSRLRESGVTTIVNVTTELPEISIDDIKVITLRINDSCSEVIRHLLHKITDMLLKLKLSGETVLVHCVAGVSRSPSVVLAYLVKHEGLSLREAFFKLKESRPVIRPNANFFKQLIEFEEEIRGSSSVKILSIPGSTIIIPDVFEEEIKMMSKCRSWRDMIKARSNIYNQFT